MFALLVGSERWDDAYRRGGGGGGWYGFLPRAACGFDARGVAIASYAVGESASVGRRPGVSTMRPSCTRNAPSASAASSALGEPLRRRMLVAIDRAKLFSVVGGGDVVANA